MPTEQSLTQLQSLLHEYADFLLKLTGLNLKIVIKS